MALYVIYIIMDGPLYIVHIQKATEIHGDSDKGKLNRPPRGFLNGHFFENSFCQFPDINNVEM